MNAAFYHLSRPASQSPARLVSRLSERAALVVAADLAFGEWPSAFGDAKMTAAPREERICGEWRMPAQIRL